MSHVFVPLTFSHVSSSRLTCRSLLHTCAAEGSSSLICRLEDAGVCAIEKSPTVHEHVRARARPCARVPVLMTYFYLLLSFYFLASKSAASSLPSHLRLHVYVRSNHMVCLGAMYIQLKRQPCCVLTGEVLFSCLG